MLNQERDHVPRHTRPAPSTGPTDTTAFAGKVAEEYDQLEAGYLAGLYRFFGKALTSYRKYRIDQSAYEELLELDYIAKLREKPEVKETSRLVLYKLTTARDGARRNAAGRYARVIDYLFQQKVTGTDAAKYVEDAGGQDAILKLARGHAATKDVGGDEIVQEDQEVDQEEDDEDRQAVEADLNGMIEGEPNTTINLDTDLVVTLKKELLSEILGDDFPTNKQFVLVCRRTSCVELGRVRVIGKMQK